MSPMHILLRHLFTLGVYMSPDFICINTIFKFKLLSKRNLLTGAV